MATWQLWLLRPLDKKDKRRIFTGILSIWGKILTDTDEKMKYSQIRVLFYLKIQHFPADSIETSPLKISPQ